jgi:hypothetical protein
LMERMEGENEDVKKMEVECIYDGVGIITL